MAVFPKKIALKSTNNAQGRLSALLADSPIQSGELVFQTQGDDMNVWGRTQSGKFRKLAPAYMGSPTTPGIVYEPYIEPSTFQQLTINTPIETLIDDLVVIVLTVKSLESGPVQPLISAIGWTVHNDVNGGADYRFSCRSYSGDRRMFTYVLSKAATANGAESVEVLISYDLVTFGHGGAGYEAFLVRDPLARMEVLEVEGYQAARGDTPYIGCATKAGGITYGHAYADLLPEIEANPISSYWDINEIDAWNYIRGDDATELTPTSPQQNGLTALASTYSSTGFDAARTNPSATPTADTGGRAGIVTIACVPSGAAKSNLNSLAEIGDVDLSTPPDIGDALVWNGNAWIASSQPPTMGSPSGTVVRVNGGTQVTAGSGTATNLGRSGFVAAISTTDPAWITAYSSSAARAADASRAFGVDPQPGAGVLFEALCDGVNPVEASPGTSYFNSEPGDSKAIYISAREPGTSSGISCVVFINAYMHQGFNEFGTSRVDAVSTPDASGEGVFTDIGQSGMFVSAKCDSLEDPWLTFYSTEQARINDASRAYGQMPTGGSGVVADFQLESGVTQIATPTQFYFNADIMAAEKIYYAVRDSSKVPITSDVEITVFAEAEVNTIDGGTYGTA